MDRKPVTALRPRLLPRSSPRPHGEARVVGRRSAPRPGLSPATRGSRRGLCVRGRPRGSIPAHTGKPQRSSCPSRSERVYPRSHGEAARRRSSHAICMGLSPLTRGSRQRTGRGRNWSGSIPAHTGKPPGGIVGRDPGGVYPRSHGEAERFHAVLLSGGGLSPLTRGSLRLADSRAEGNGSIPAHTGKPRSSCWRWRPPAVYPRSHGEAFEAVGNGVWTTGLSPLTRGSPSLPNPRFNTRKVYPRSHGEAFEAVGNGVWTTGLSPLTRGSLTCGRPLVRWAGSIPAHTGKPRRVPRRYRDSAVYPRSHGEARDDLHFVADLHGLSPLTRGSHIRPSADFPSIGSIPAHTGKPGSRWGWRSITRVYPRSHGEAAMQEQAVYDAQGLSPLTRGSRRGSRRYALAFRSIPAHTGKP